MNINQIVTNTNLDTPIDISIPLRFGGDQPNVYGVDPAVSKPCEYGDFVGDTRRGGSVNFEKYTFIPHCNGTHTECVGHITDERIAVRDCLKDVFSEALLLTVGTVNAIESGENYPYEVEARDEFITKRDIKAALESTHSEDAVDSPGPRPSSLIIRTIPNDDSKLARAYDRPVPPFFSNEAIKYIVESGFKHLLVDLPSIDRLYDDGKLSNHRIFWNVDAGSKTLIANSRKASTITELIHVPNEINDGEYILNLQIAPFVTDAVPSRPILFPNKKEIGRPF